MSDEQFDLDDVCGDNVNFMEQYENIDDWVAAHCYIDPGPTEAAIADMEAVYADLYGDAIEEELQAHFSWVTEPPPELGDPNDIPL